MSKIGPLTPQQKAQEARVRRAAKALGYRLHKEKVREPSDPRYGKYYLHYAETHQFITDLTLDQVMGYVMKRDPSLVGALETVRAALRTLAEGGFKLTPCDDRDLRNDCVGHIGGQDGIVGSIIQCKCGGQHVTIWEDERFGPVLFTDDPHWPYPRKDGDDRTEEA